MKKLILIILFLITLLSCELYTELAILSYDIKIDGLNSLSDIADWINTNIEYKTDEENDWQTPQETYEGRAGDCEDTSLLFMYLAKQYLDKDSEILLTEWQDVGHAIARVENTYYYFEEGQTADNLVINYTYHYLTAMQIAAYER